MQIYCNSLTEYNRLKTIEVNVGGLLIGNLQPIRLQTMTTTDTMNTLATVEQSIRCIEAGAELVRITAPSKNEAENLLNIKNEIRKRGYHTPLVADIHFTPNAAEIAARIVEKVRINPGNYIDKKKFDIIEYNDAEYAEEIERIRNRFLPLIKICKEYGTAMRIGTNHGSLSDRIMSRYGDTANGMVESAMEFLRVARDESYHNIVLSMKSSNPQVMVQAYRLLAKTMHEEFNELYPLHLGVTEAGDAEDGRIKSAVGIGTLLEDGIGDTIRVSLTEDPEFEIPVCRDLVKRYEKREKQNSIPSIKKLTYNPFEYKRRKTFQVDNIGDSQVPVVIADLSKVEKITPQTLESIGYKYDENLDKWNIADAAADFIFTGSTLLNFNLPGTLKVIVYSDAFKKTTDHTTYYPIFDIAEIDNALMHSKLNFVMVDCFSDDKNNVALEKIANKPNVVICFSSMNHHAMPAVRRMFVELDLLKIKNPVVLICDSNWQTADEHLIHYSTECGALFLDGMGDGICLGMNTEAYRKASQLNASGRNYLNNTSTEQFINNTAFGILQATRTRISKTEYISCPSCGRTLFELQETTAKIRSVTNHLKGLKIAIMGCIVNGPGEMADADFGYVGSGPGKITLYKGKEVVRKNIDAEIAVDSLIDLLKENNVWVDA
jgi:(E)-4-hydroxy-3-methylbut-2-enyl-diphosphate synthase